MLAVKVSDFGADILGKVHATWKSNLIVCTENSFILFDFYFNELNRTVNRILNYFNKKFCE